MVRKMTRGRWLTVALLLNAVGSAPGCGRASLDLRIERAAAALFNEFETVSKTDVGRLPFHTLANRMDADPEGVLFVPFGYLFESLQFFGLTTAERVAGQTSVILSGASDFRSPTGFGAVASRNCYVLLVKPGFRLEDFFGRAPTEYRADVPVWRWTTKMGEYGEGDDRASALVAMQLNASYVLISNDAERIVNVAQALTTVQSTEVLARLSEWPEVSTTQYWMYRRYRFNNVIDPLAAAIGDVRRDADSLVFFTNPAGQPATLRLVSSQAVATQPERIVPKRQLLPGEPPLSRDETPRFPHLLPAGPNSWATAVPMSGRQVEWESVLTVMVLMGFGIYV